MKIGIVCYASIGGSGIVATELGKCLASRGHEVRLLSSDVPVRLPSYQPGLAFHQVQSPSYPLFREPQYLLALANKLVQVSRAFGLDVIHAHYAVPHAAAAYLARQILGATGRAPRVITTLHGTDVTLVGSDSSYVETVAFCIDQSDGVTAVSASLKQDTYRALPVGSPIRVIPNFLDCEIYRRRPDPALRARFSGGDEAVKLVAHASNFRPVKRIGAVVEVFHRIRRDLRAKLLLIGDGPDLEAALRLAGDLGVAGDVQAVGEQDRIVPLLSIADLFLLPSAQESFGLAALEAMACGVPVVASCVGGLPEVIEHGVSGFLHAPDDLAAMAESGRALLTDPGLHRRVRDAALEVARGRFGADRIIPLYEEVYREVTSVVSA